MLVLLIVVGLYRIYIQDLGPIDVDTYIRDGVLSEEAAELASGSRSLGILLLLRAFASGAVALSGVEAVSNGVPAFRKPEPRNAAITIGIMGVVLGSCFLGVSIVASHLRPYRGEFDPTGHRADGPLPLRRARSAVLDHPGVDLRHPHPRGEHRLRRLPAPRVDHR